MGSARNTINVLTSDVIVACPGGAGTLSEIALALKHGKPVWLLNFDVGGVFTGCAAKGQVAFSADAESCGRRYQEASKRCCERTIASANARSSGCVDFDIAAASFNDFYGNPETLHQKGVVGSPDAVLARPAVGLQKNGVAESLRGLDHPDVFTGQGCLRESGRRSTL